MKETLTRPAWQINLLQFGESRNLTPTIASRLISLSVTDERGTESDAISLTLDDADGGLALPPTGALIEVALGWGSGALVNKGTFTIDDVSHDGPPDKVSITGRGARVSHSLTVKKERSWHEITVGDLCLTIAKEHGLTPKISAELAALQIAHIDQTGESDTNFLTRLARNYNAIAAVKAGNLLFLPSGASRTVSGAALQAITISRSEGDTHRYHSDDRGKYSGIRAYWQDVGAAERKSVLLGTEGREKALRDTYPTEEEAKRAASAELQRIDNGSATLSITLARGRPEIVAESPVTCTGFKREINQVPWLVKSAKHELDGSGLRTSLELETRKEKKG